MPRVPGKKFGRKSNQGPDAYDLSAISVECAIHFGVRPTWEIECAEPNVFQVRCSLDYALVGTVVRHYTTVRRCSAESENLHHVMLQAAHVVYHLADNDKLRAAVVDS